MTAQQESRAGQVKSIRASLELLHFHCTGFTKTRNNPDEMHLERVRFEDWPDDEWAGEDGSKQGVA